MWAERLAVVAWLGGALALGTVLAWLLGRVSEWLGRCCDAGRSGRRVRLCPVWDDRRCEGCGFARARGGVIGRDLDGEEVRR